MEISLPQKWILKQPYARAERVRRKISYRLSTDKRSGSFIALGWYDVAEAGQTVAVRSRMEESPGSRERDAG